jgi:hypothetical protein
VNACQLREAGVFFFVLQDGNMHTITAAVSRRRKKEV